MKTTQPLEFPMQQAYDLADLDVTYIVEKNRKIAQEHSKLNSKLRQTSDYLINFWQNHPGEIINYKKISNDLGIKEGTIRICIQKLATWKDWQLTIVNTPKKKGYFQLVSKNFEDSEKWITRNDRYTGTKIQRLRKTKTELKTKKKTNKIKQVIKIFQK